MPMLLWLPFVIAWGVFSVMTDVADAASRTEESD
jgi:hypothetical protein